MNKTNVLVCGIGGASLGTEIIKSLQLVYNYNIYGCDISPYAYGHYLTVEGVLTELVHADERYVDDIIKLCKIYNIAVLIFGGEEPYKLLYPHVERFNAIGVTVAGNSHRVDKICSNKADFFNFAELTGIPIPKTQWIYSIEDFVEDSIPIPCVVKPATGTGGSAMVFFAETADQARTHCEFILQNRICAIIQEYIPADEGEFTVGVLNGTRGEALGSIAMRRIFDAKLSVIFKNKSGVISSGYYQGFVDRFPHVCKACKEIANTLHSCGPLNIQGRVRNGEFLVFEVNPRFSASTFLRTLAGFNEVDIFIQHTLYGTAPAPINLRVGYYLRLLRETFVPVRDIVHDKLTFNRSHE